MPRWGKVEAGCQAVALLLSSTLLTGPRLDRCPIPKSPLESWLLYGAGCSSSINLFPTVRQDNNFRRFLQVRVLIALGTMAVGFLTVAAIQRWQVPDSTVGIFTAALLIGQTGSQLGAGILADRLGHKLALEMGCAAGFLAFFLAWVAPAVPWFYAAFALLGVSGGMILVSGTLITMEFSAPAQRPTYIGIANTAVGIANAIAPLVGGWLTSFDYNWVFVGSAGLNLLALFLMRWYVEDPRQLVQKPVK